MSDKTAARIIGGLLAFVLLLALGAVRSSRTAYEAVGVQAEKQTTQSIYNEERSSRLTPKDKTLPTKRDCETKNSEADENTSEFWPPLFGFRFKVTDSLLVLFTGFLAWSTRGLQRSTVGLQDAADEQARITNRLFSVDQRPWLLLTLAPDEKRPPEFDEEKGWIINVIVRVANIGKSPAINAADTIINHVGYDTVEDDYASILGFLEAQSYSKGTTLFPSEDDSWGFNFAIGSDGIEKSSLDLDGMQYITVGYSYKSTLQDDILTIIRTYKYGIGGIHKMLPVDVSDSGDGMLNLKLWKEYIT